MRVTNRQIAAAVRAQLEGGMSPATATRSLAAYLVAERRSKDLSAIMREIERRMAVDDGVLAGSVTSARPLSKSTQDHITRLLKAETGVQKVQLHEDINQDVLGGVVVESSELRLDLTVRRQLQRLKGIGV